MGLTGRNTNHAITAAVGLGPHVAEEGRPESVRPEGPKSARAETEWAGGTNSNRSAEVFEKGLGRQGERVENGFSIQTGSLRHLESVICVRNDFERGV